jgi:hypothetical protein
MESLFNLSDVFDLLEAGRLITTQRARLEAEREFGFSLKQVEEVLLELSERDFHETILSRQTNRPNDVYLKNIYSPIYCRSVKTYIKIEIHNELILISFHTSTDYF